jgi:hypothetical protein
MSARTAVHIHWGDGEHAAAELVDQKDGEYGPGDRERGEPDPAGDAASHDSPRRVGDLICARVRPSRAPFALERDMSGVFPRSKPAAVPFDRGGWARTG